MPFRCKKRAREAYEQLRAERERCRREAAEKEAAHRRGIEEHANARVRISGAFSHVNDLKHGLFSCSTTY